VNLCRACGQDFGSVSLFDRHRVGVHAHTYSEGLKFDPPVEDGRRCLYVDEMKERGWTLGKRGRWLDPSQGFKLGSEGLRSPTLKPTGAVEA
jgi:hypothetical protein